MASKKRVASKVLLPLYCLSLGSAKGGGSELKVYQVQSVEYTDGTFAFRWVLDSAVAVFSYSRSKARQSNRIRSICAARAKDYGYPLLDFITHNQPVKEYSELELLAAATQEP
jgi:hypothetical protein